MQVLPKILVIDSSVALAGALRETLQNEYHINTAPNAKSGIYKSELDNYAAIILALDLPDIGGLGVCQILRERDITSPILVLSSKAELKTKIQLLNAGADDYMTKPISVGELKARLRALIRAREMKPKPRLGLLTYRDLVLDPVTHQATRAGTPLSLRRKEFLLLECLLLHADQVVTRQALGDYAWPGVERTRTNTLDVHIKRLRDKVDRDFDRPLIATVHGVGLKLTSDQPYYIRLSG